MRNFKDAYIGTDGGKRLSFILCNVFYGIGSDLKLSIPTYILHAKFIEIDDAIFRNKREFEKKNLEFHLLQGVSSSISSFTQSHRYRTGLL